MQIKMRVTAAFESVSPKKLPDKHIVEIISSPAAAPVSIPRLLKSFTAMYPDANAPNAFTAVTIGFAASVGTCFSLTQSAAQRHNSIPLIISPKAAPVSSDIVSLTDLL